MPDEPIKKAVEDAPEALDDNVVVEAILDELAALNPVEYDRRREEEAEKLSVRITTLDQEVKKRRRSSGSNKVGGGSSLSLPVPEPWSDPVDGQYLLDELVGTFHRFIALPAGAAEAIALWVLHTHTFEASPITPRLVLQSPERRCGKTRTLEVLSRLVPKPLLASNVSTSVVFRVIEMARPTLLIDEADTFIKDNKELCGVLNSGHHQTGKVIRSVTDDHEPRVFSTWAPVAIALIGQLDGTLEDRAIIIYMRRRRSDERIERLRIDRSAGLDEIARKATRWAVDNQSALREADPNTPDALHDRAADNWRPLLAIADCVGGEWPVSTRTIAQQLSTGGPGEDSSVKTQLLIDIRAIMDSRAIERIASADLVGALAGMEDRPWPEWRNGKPITTRGVARLLADFEIRSQTIRLGSNSTAKGYLLDDFKDTFTRYIDDLSVTPSQSLSPVASSENLSVTTGGDVTDRKARKPAGNKECYAVTDKKGGKGDAWGMEI